MLEAFCLYVGGILIYMLEEYLSICWRNIYLYIGGIGEIVIL